jgi:hypothetical protein
MGTAMKKAATTINDLAPAQSESHNADAPRLRVWRFRELRLGLPGDIA